MVRCLVLACAVGLVGAFAPSVPGVGIHPRDVARAGIFDGVKDAFSQEASILDEDRVTPFGASSRAFRRAFECVCDHLRAVRRPMAGDRRAI